VRPLHVGGWFALLVTLLAALASALLVGSARSANHAAGLIAFTRHDGIYAMRADGSGVRALRRGGVASSADGLAWSPDGRTLAFVSFQAGKRDIWVIDADGTDLRRLFAASEHGLSIWGPLTWSPRGRKIAFTATRSDEDGADVWVVDSDGSNLRRLARTPRLMEYEADWSPRRRIAVSGITGSWTLQISVMNADGSSQRLISPPAVVGAEEAMPDWSPDGRTIAFMRWRHDLEAGYSGISDILDSEIWVMNPDGRSRVRLTRNAVQDRDPVWSPDGSQIAFIRWGGKAGALLGPPPARRSTREIFVMNADGTEATRLTHNGVGEGSLAWQPVAAR
jgi:TolB protein